MDPYLELFIATAPAEPDIPIYGPAVEPYDREAFRAAALKKFEDDERKFQEKLQRERE